jgi:hypothetical protein
LDDAPAESSASASYTLDGTLWWSDGYYDGDMYVEGLAIYFSDGKAYFGQAGMYGDEIISSGLDTYGGVPYTYDGYTIHIEAYDGTTADYTFDGTYIWAGETMFWPVY